MILSTLAIHEAAQALLGCVCEALDRLPDEVPGLAGCPCRTGVVPGDPAADGCDGGCAPLEPGTWPGQLTVNVVRLYASDTQVFPRELGTFAVQGGVRSLTQCAVPQVTAVELQVTLWRCVPGPTEGGCPPSIEDLTVSAVQLHADMLAVQQGVICCYPSTVDTRKGRKYVMGQTTTVGPQGGCVGFQTRLITALDGTVAPIPATPLTAVQDVS